MLEIAVLWLVNKEKELLLTKRTLSKISDPNKWGPTVTGTADYAETPDQTLIREVEEELGLKPNDYKPEFLFTIDFNHADGKIRRFSIYFALVRKEITNQFVVETKEVADMKWLPIEQVKDMLVNGSNAFELIPSAKVVWPKTFEMLENKW